MALSPSKAKIKSAQLAHQPRTVLTKSWPKANASSKLKPKSLQLLMPHGPSREPKVLSLDEAFYRNVAELAKRTQSVPAKAGSCGDERGTERDGKHVLSFEEEQCLGESVAFLAESGTAVAIEQFLDPIGLVVRLVSDGSLSSEFIDGLDKVLGVVEDFARAGTDRDLFHSNLFSTIVENNKTRIYDIITKPQKSKSWNSPFYIRISSLVSSIQKQHPDLKVLYGRLCALRKALVAVSHPSRSSSHQREFVQTAVERAFDASMLGDCGSLERYLRSKGVRSEISGQDTVRNIDLLSRYLTLCNDLIKLSMTSEPRAVFTNISLECLIQPSPSTPPGAKGECCIHPEIQLAFFYEQNPEILPPRVISTSEYACFLCDLFFQKLGRFCITSPLWKDGKRRVCEQWMFPLDIDWMNPKQKHGLQNVKKVMNNELISLIEHYHGQGFSPCKPKKEIISKEYIPSLSNNDVPVPVNRIAIPRVATPVLSLVTNTSAVDAMHKVRASNTSTQILHIENLPVKRPIIRSTTTLKLQMGKTECRFDARDVESGELQIDKVANRKKGKKKAWI